MIKIKNKMFLNDVDFNKKVIDKKKIDAQILRTKYYK